jgi:bifunctional non-homologous end joining protein LigD
VLDYYARIAPESWAKSSGSIGVQVYVPLNTPVTFAATKAFARNVAEVMAARMPERVVARVDKRLARGGCWSTGARTTATSPPSRRTPCGPNASAPRCPRLSWDELAAAVDRRDERALLPSPAEVLERVDQHETCE